MAVETSAVDTSTAPIRQQQKHKASMARRVWSSYAFRRIRQGIITIYAVAIGTFFLVRLMPGDPVAIMAGRLTEGGMARDQALRVAAASIPYDVNAPLWQQFVDFMVKAHQLDFGTTLSGSAEPVIDRILKYMPWTMFSVGVGVSIAIVLGVTMGMLLAYRRNGLLDHILTPIGAVLAGVPNYLFIAALILIGSVSLGWFNHFPLLGRTSPGVEVGFNGEFFADALYHGMLPILAYIVTVFGGWMLTMKATTSDTMGEEFVTVARARGLSSTRISSQYVGRNAVLPLMPQIAIQIGTVMGGAIIVEQLLKYDGMGVMYLTAVQARDFPVVQAATIFFTISIVAATLIVDLCASRLDPRIRLDDKGGK